MRRSSVFAVVTSLVLLLGVPGAGAVPPEVDEFGPFVFGPDLWFDINGEPVACKDGVRHHGADADFYILQQTEVEGTHKHFVTKGGAVIKHQTWVGGTDWLINSADESKYVMGDWHVTDFERTTRFGEPLGQFTVRGLGWHIVAPGHGSIFMEAGQLVLDFSLPGDPFVAFHGKSDFGAQEYDAVCAALS